MSEINYTGGERVLDDFMTEIVFTATSDLDMKVEQRLRVLVQPKPGWVPQRVWDRLLRRVLMIERHPLRVASDSSREGNE